VPWHLASIRAVSGHLPSERSACLTDAECQGKFLPDAECQGKCRTDTTCHGICLLDEEFLRHPDAVHLTDAECQGKWDPDESYDGTPHIGNRVVIVAASKRNHQGTVHCSEEY